MFAGPDLRPILLDIQQVNQMCSEHWLHVQRMITDKERMENDE